jgi:hypothetical protein
MCSTEPSVQSTRTDTIHAHILAHSHHSHRQANCAGQHAILHNIIQPTIMQSLSPRPYHYILITSTSYTHHRHSSLHALIHLSCTHSTADALHRHIPIQNILHNIMQYISLSPHPYHHILITRLTTHSYLLPLSTTQHNTIIAQHQSSPSSSMHCQ